MTQSTDCLFCSIIAGTIPVQRVYEDTDTLAFLDVHPVNPGHLLVIPKEHVADIRDVSDTALTAVMRTVKKMANLLTTSLHIEGVNVMQNSGRDAGQVVFHLHVHVIPRTSGDGHEQWHGSAYADGEWVSMGERLRSAIQS